MKIYTDNLSLEVTDDDLRLAFEKFGQVESVTITKDKLSGKSKGFGFVTFKDDESANKAISEMNDKEVEGRNLKVNEARPMEDRPPRRDSR